MVNLQVDKDGNTVRYKFYQGPEGYEMGRTEYGKKAHSEERPPIEKMWAEYQAAHKDDHAHH